MRVVVDLEVCELNALCVVEAPSVFQIVTRDGQSQLEVVLLEPPDDLGPAVRAAADVCPKAAISVEEAP